MKHYLLIAFLLITLTTDSQVLNPSGILYKEMYFNAFLNFSENKENYRKNAYENMYLNDFGTLYSFIGKYDKAIELFTILNKKKGYIPDSLRKIKLKRFGIKQDSLNKLYKNVNVVMFNEAHHISQHRAFLYSQLEVLKSLGYNQLALEALNKEDTLLKERKYPVKSTGFYINDPVYGNVIRKALELGFTLISYDVYKTFGREKGEAKNIFKKYNPNKGKLVVYAGYGHISETGKWKMMGQFLNKYLNEDLLTISQFTPYNVKPEFPSDDNYEFYLMKDADKQFDYYIYAKPKPSVLNIPYWYDWMNFETKPLKDIYSESIMYPTLIQILNINEKNAVPVYQYMIEKDENVLIAFPKTGEYILKVFDKNGKKEYKVHL